jgi:hypothetical protein
MTLSNACVLRTTSASIGGQETIEREICLSARPSVLTTVSVGKEDADMGNSEDKRSILIRTGYR